jgi:hypothetical protein
MKTAFTSLFLFATFVASHAQNAFDLQLDTFTLPGLPGLHSFAVAQHDGKWLLLGGRKDGLHPKSGGFQTSAANHAIYVVEPLSGQVFQKQITELPDTLQEQLRSANMEFFQHGETLLFAGGYGRSETVQEYITYPYLTLIDVPGLMNAVVQNDSLLPHFQQVRDTFFAVAGGQLEVLSDTFCLVGGHRFEGIYAANSGGNILQFYTNAIRKFTLETTANGWQVTHKSQVIDELNLHRRDYNLAPQILENGEPGLVAFSGVFQPGQALLPFLNAVEIRPSGHSPVNGFSQFLANYHCAKAPLFSQSANEMHTLFFGGMSQYHLNANDSLIQDNRIPFVKTVSRVSRLAGGSYEEVAFDAELPFFTGTSAEFLFAEGVPLLPNGVADLDALPDSSSLLGYLVGGIVTPGAQPNPFTANLTGITSASNLLIKVFLDKSQVSASPAQPVGGRFDLGLTVFPNPATDALNLRLHLPKPGWLRFFLQNMEGKIVRQFVLENQPAGEVNFSLPTGDLSGGTYWLTAIAGGVFMETQTVLKF